MKVKRANPLSPLSSAHAAKVEKWLGAEKIQHLQDCMANGGNRWYGRPICLVDVPGSLWITADGDFVGYVNDSIFSNAVDYFTDRIKMYWEVAGRPTYALGVGFADISDALLRASSGYGQELPFAKSGATGVVGASSTMWRVGTQPASGSAGAAAPGGTAHTSANTGALTYTNPASGTMHLVGADAGLSVINNTLLIYDRLFSVAKTMASTATEAVTGVPTRYQSTTDTDPDYIGGNFGFIEIGGTALAATAHNWTTCLYTDQANASSTLPSVTGNSAGIVDRLDQPTYTWFAPLASGDLGIKAWTQMQCSASVATGAINFCIGHPLGWMSFPVINSFMPFDWLTNKRQAPRIFDSACLAFLEPLKPATNATTYTGTIQITSAAA